MNTALWICQVLLAAAYLAAGGMKLLVPSATLRAAPRMAWMEDFSAAQVRLIGFAEVAGAAGLVLPGLLHIAEWLVPLAAAGLALDMLGAYATHLRRNEPGSAQLPAMVLGVLAAVVAVGRYWAAPL